MVATITIDRSRSTRTAAVLSALFLAALTIKDWQEVAGIRVLSTGLPLLFFYFLKRAACPITVPKPVLWLVATECVTLPAISVFAKKHVSFYEFYLPWTAVSAVLLIAFYRNFVCSDFERIGKLYAKSLIPICLLTFAFTSERTWFGAYALASLSDFSTFFALQISVAMPFVLFRWKNSTTAFYFVTLWFLFSRLSLVLAIVTVAIQRTRVSNVRNLLRSVITAGGVAVAGFFLAQTSLGTELAYKLINTASSLIGSNNDALSELNPSDLGRLAYIATTINAITPSSLLWGHGIRTNHEIILDELDTSAWSLDDSFSIGAVHNVYIEILSDCGIFVLLGLLILVLYVLNRLRRRGGRDPVFLASVVFFASYMFESNYVTFFFQFFLIYFVWVAASTPVRTKSASDGRSHVFGALSEKLDVQ